MMKKYALFLALLFCGFNVHGEGIILSDTSVDGYDNIGVVQEEPFVAPENKMIYASSQSYNQPVGTGKALIGNDTSDPLFLTPDNSFLSDTFVRFYDRKFRFGQYFDYGINNNLVVHATMLYQWDLSGRKENGFSATEFGGVYRMNNGSGNTRIVSDALFGLKLWGASRVRTPEYADSSYYAGFRFGRKYAGLTLAGTVKSTWVFDDSRGLSYIDFIPETYFRFKYDWRAGLGLDIRRSTNKHLLDNQEWLNLKLLRQYGNTQYVASFDYEFESSEIQIGFNVKVLF